MPILKNPPLYSILDKFAKISVRHRSEDLDCSSHETLCMKMETLTPVLPLGGPSIIKTTGTPFKEVQEILNGVVFSG